jgi:hypothetical protein
VTWMVGFVFCSIIPLFDDLMTVCTMYSIQENVRQISFGDAHSAGARVTLFSVEEISESAHTEILKNHDAICIRFLVSDSLCCRHCRL